MKKGTSESEDDENVPCYSKYAVACECLPVLVSFFPIHICHQSRTDAVCTVRSGALMVQALSHPRGAFPFSLAHHCWFFVSFRRCVPPMWPRFTVLIGNELFANYARTGWHSIRAAAVGGWRPPPGSSGKRIFRDMPPCASRCMHRDAMPHYEPLAATRRCIATRCDARKICFGRADATRREGTQIRSAIFSIRSSFFLRFVVPILL